MIGPTLPPRDEEERAKMLQAFLAGMHYARMQQGLFTPSRKPGRPKGSRYLGDIDRSRCLAVEAIRARLWAAGDEAAYERSDPAIVRIARMAANQGWASDEDGGLSLELLAKASEETVIVSVRKGRARMAKRRINSRPN